MTTTTTHDAPTVSDMIGWIEERSLSWELADLAVERIDMDMSRDNQVRLQALNEEVVERYAEDMRRGDTFPPIIVAAHGAGFRILGGNHRHAAAAVAGQSHIASIIVDGPAETLQLLSFEDNRKHGLAPSDEDRIGQANILMDQGWSEKAAAEAVGIGVGKVQRARGVEEAERRAVQLDVPAGFFALPASSRWRLGNVKSDPVFAAAAECAIATQMTSSEVFTWVTELNNARSEADAMTMIGARQVELEQRQDARNGKARSGQTQVANVRLNAALTTLLGLDDVATVNSLPIGDPRDVMVGRLREARTKMSRLIKALEGDA